MTTPYTGLINETVSLLSRIESQVLQETKLNLLQRVTGVWARNDDDLFEHQRDYCVECWNAGIPERASQFWVNILSKEVMASDKALSKQSPSSCIHKGAPLYNAGVGYILAGNLDKAVELISQAGQEEARRGTDDSSGLVLGNHVLTEGLILKPLMVWLKSSGWDTTYSEVTAEPLNLTELKDLINWLKVKPENAIQLVVCLLRLKEMDPAPQNDAVRHMRVRTLADMLLIVESSLRAWQTFSPSPRPEQLYGRVESLVSVNRTALGAFKAAERRFSFQFPKDAATNIPHRDKETSIGVNWMIQDSITSLLAATNVATRAGICCHMVARLRNSLMHVIDGTVELYEDNSNFFLTAHVVLSVIRLSKCGQDGKVSDLQTT